MVDAPLTLPVPKSPAHLELGLKQVGRTESKDIDWVMGLFAFTDFPKKLVDRNTAWCAAWICQLMSKCGLKSTRSASAKRQEDLGVKCPDNEPGAIAVWQHREGPLKGRFHTNMIIRKIDKNTWECVGGNQNNAVTIARYGPPSYALMSTRRPVKQ